MFELYVSVGLLLFLMFMFYLEVLKKIPSDNLLIVIMGICIIIQSYLGGIGSFFSFAPSLILSLSEIILAFFFYLPYKRFFTGKWHLFYYLIVCCMALGPIGFIKFYFYTSLVCSLLSIALVFNDFKRTNKKITFRNLSGWGKNTEGKIGIQAPYYTSGFIAYVLMLIFKDM